MGYEGEQFELLTAYVDGELTQAQRAEVEQLLARDEPARALVERLRRTARLVGSLPRGRAPADLAGRVMAQLERESLLDYPETKSATLGRRVRWWRGLAAAAALALAVTASWLVIPTLRSEKAARETITLAQREPAPPEIAIEGKADRGLTRADRMTVRSAGKASDELTTKEPAALAAGLPPDAARERESLASAEGRAKSPGPATIEGPTDSKSRGLFATPAASTPAPEEKLALADGVDKDEESGLGGGRGLAESMAAQSRGHATGLAMRRVQPAAPDFKDKAGGEPESTAAEVADDEALGERFRVFYDERVAEQGESAADGSFEHLLAANVLANGDLRRVRAAAFTNRIVVDTDPATQARLVGRIEGFMAGRNVPNAQVEPLAEPIAPTQAFYFVQSAPTGSPSMAAPAVTAPGLAAKPAVPADEQGGREVEILMNVRRVQVPELVAALEEASREDQAQTSWTANSVPVAGENLGYQVVQQLVPADREPALNLDSARGQNAGYAANKPAQAAENERGGTLAEDRAAKEAPRIRAVTSTPAESPGKMAAGRSGDDEGRPADAGRMLTATTQSQERDRAEYVALAILVRGRVLPQEAAAVQGPPEPTTQDAPQAGAPVAAKRSPVEPTAQPAARPASGPAAPTGSGPRP
jgi:hypothetical protein